MIQNNGLPQASTFVASFKVNKFVHFQVKSAPPKAALPDELEN